MATRDNAFSPSPGGTVCLNVTTTSTAAAFGTAATAALGTKGTVSLFNLGPNLVFFRIGLSGQTSPTALVPVAAGALGDMPLIPGIPITIDMGDAVAFAAVTATGLATLYATPGQGSL